MNRYILLIVGAGIPALCAVAGPSNSTSNVNVVNTPSVSVTNTPSVTVANTPNVTVTNTPSVIVANTAPLAVAPIAQYAPATDWQPYTAMINAGANTGTTLYSATVAVPSDRVIVAYKFEIVMTQQSTEGSCQAYVGLFNASDVLVYLLSSHEYPAGSHGHEYMPLPNLSLAGYRVGVGARNYSNMNCFAKAQFYTMPM